MNLIADTIRRLGGPACVLLTLVCAGCHGLGARTTSPPVAANQSEVVNQIFVAHNDQDVVWERIVDVVHDYFEIERENRLDGIIETKPLVGASLLEPWHHDAVGLSNRLEGTLQSVRRRGFINVTPADGGYMVSVAILKEQEDVNQTPDKSAGNSTFQENRPLQRDLTLVVGDAAPQGWLSLGHDQDLENKMLQQIQSQLAATTPRG